MPPGKSRAPRLVTESHNRPSWCQIGVEFRATVASPRDIVNLKAACDAGVSTLSSMVAIVPGPGRWWQTMPEVACAIRTELGSGDTDAALRTLLDGINRLPAIAAEGHLADALAEPDSVGDRRWDTLLAASIRYRLHQMGERAPGWTLKEPLDTFWWPVRINLSKEYIDMAHSPAELLRVGIFLDDRAFTSA